MKKRIGIISAILVIALVCVLTFALLASAEEANEATLKVTTASGTTTQAGSYDQMAEALNSAMSSLGEGTATLTLNSDAVATKKLTLAGNGTETVVIDLAGYTLDVSAVQATPIFVDAVKSFSINGGYSLEVDNGAIVSTSASEGIIEIDESEQLTAYELYDLNISYASSGASAIVHNDDDELVLRNVDITYAAATADAATKVIDVTGGSLTLVNSKIIDAKTAGGASYGIVATAATVRLENTEIKADYVYSMNGGTWLTAVDATLEASGAIFTAANPTDDTVIGAGVIFKGNILGEGATKEMIKLYYGTGLNIIDTDPTDKVTIATALATLGTTSSGKWTLIENQSNQVIYTQVFDRGSITEKADTLGNAAKQSAAASPTKSVFTIAVIANKEFDTTTVPLLNGNAIGNSSVFLNLNGYTLTQKKATHLFNANTGLFRLAISGMNSEGQMGMVKNIGYAGGVIYVKDSNPKSVLTFKDVEIRNTNAAGRIIKYYDENGNKEKDDSNSSANMVQIQDLRVYVDGIYFHYTGENYGRGYTVGVNAESYDEYQYYYKTAATAPMFMLQSTAFLTAENSKFHAEATGALLAANIPAASTVFSCSASSSVLTTNSAFAKNCEFVGTGIIGSTADKEANQIRIADSKISVVRTAFSGITTNKYPVYVSDCDITLASGVALAAGNVVLLNGDGKMKITTKDGSIPSGTHTLEEGSAIIFDTASEGYIIVNGDSVSNIALNKLFANGMVFQAGKPINVWGTGGEEGATISVTLGENTATATVTAGKWEATLPAMSYAKGLTLTVQEEGKEAGNKTYTNVDIGEVWALSGQSNANLGAYKMEDFEEYKALADLYDNIRCFSVQADTTENVLSDAKNAQWFQITSKNVGMTDTGLGLSAVGYVMATRLAVELEGNPTIAIVDINYNGKAISNFISNEYDPYEGFNASYHDKHADAAHQVYNSMIAPFTGYNIAGFGWYQGEATYDSGECDSASDGNYGLNVDQLYATYTETFNKNAGNAPLELFIVQLSAYMNNPSYIRAYQQDIAAKNEHYHVISSSWAGSVLADKDFALDSGNGFQYGHVHAARKSPLGLALADSILENVYFKDQDLAIANPEVESIVIDSATVKVTLDRDFTLMFGDEVYGFELSADGVTWVAAVGTIDGRTISLTAAGISAPKYVRYAFGYSRIELENGEWLTFSKSSEDITYTADPASSKATTATITVGDKTYVINTKDSMIIRSMLPGNIVATNGHTLHVFSTLLDSSSAGEN